MKEETWRICSICKTPIAFGTTYWVCSVSTCNRKNTDYVFCSVACWDAHLPLMKHRNAWAVEKKAPSRAVWIAEQGTAAQKKAAEKQHDQAVEKHAKLIEAQLSDSRKEVPCEILIVASRLKRYIKARSGLKTSDAVMEVLSDIVRDVADRAIRNAARAGRSTVLDRDVARPSYEITLDAHES